MPIAIVTGGESGIGKASAVALAERGFDVGITWHFDKDDARRTGDQITELGRRAELVRVDLAKRRAARSVVERLAARLGGIDVFVNNAATGLRGRFLEVSEASWRQVLDVNLTGAFLAAQRAAQLMVAAGRGGRIINITSVHETAPLPGASAYCASKGGLGMLTKVMALELSEHGITVNAVAPGEISVKGSGEPGYDPHTSERPRIPARHPGHVREVAAVVAFLASPEASYMTGASVVVDGGMLLMAAVP
jgi:NAD(P)-dependent dehydrogenase (short-subunit alcohol dehydrogenase family)